MKQFLREYWFYIVAPVAIVLVLLVAALVFAGGEESPFIYNIF